MIHIRFRKATLLFDNYIHLSFSEAKTKRITIGRSAGNSLILPGDSVSREHAQIDVRSDLVQIRDLDSTNGIFRREGLELKKISKATLNSGDRIAIGDYILDIDIVDSSEGGDNESKTTNPMQAEQVNDIVSALFDLGKKTNINRIPSSPQVRKLIDAILVVDSMLEAFIMDNYPDARNLITPGMDRVGKVNILLGLGGGNHRLDIVYNLREQHAGGFQRHKQLLFSD